MKLSSIQRLGGISLIAGAFLLTAYAVLRPLIMPVKEKISDITIIISNPNWVLISTISFIGVLLMVFGFAGVYSRIYANAGILGLLGFIFVELAYIFQACQLAWEIFIFPAIVSYGPSIPLFRDGIIFHSPLFSLFGIIFKGSIFLGILIFCISLIISRKFHMSAAILILAGAVVYAIGPALSTYVGVAGIFVLSVGCLILGMGLIRGREKAL